MTTEIKVGDSVRHPSRGTGEVVTTITNILTKRVTKAWVEFQGVGFGSCTQKFCCFVDDLVVVPKPPAPSARPALQVVEQPAGAA